MANTLNTSENNAADVSDIWKKRHTAAHVMAQAVLEMFPDAKLAIGPPIEDGFYYDFDLPRNLTPDDLKEIESRMKRLKRENHPLVRSEKPRAEALAYEESLGQNYKAELIHDLPEGEAISFYTQGNFTDLCRGPHVASTGEIGVFKIDRLAGAYWRGDEKREQLQRVYGVLFDTKEELDAYYVRLEEAKKRDHKVLGKQLGLFMNSSVVGAGPASVAAQRRDCAARSGASCAGCGACQRLPARLHAGYGEGGTLQAIGALGALQRRYVSGDED